MHRRLGLVASMTMLVAGADEARGQTSVAPPLTVHGSDNDWGTKCDLIINPLGVEVAGECDAAPPLTSWTNAFDGGAGVRAGVALGYDWGAFRLEGEYFQRGTVYGDRSDIDIFDLLKGGSETVRAAPR